MLGWVAAVRATESPSQLRPALIHRTWMTVSSAEWRARHPSGRLGAGGRGVAPGRCSPAARAPYMSVFFTPVDRCRAPGVQWGGCRRCTVTADDRAWFARCHRAWDLGARGRQDLQPRAVPPAGGVAPGPAGGPGRALLPGHVDLGPGHRGPPRAAGLRRRRRAARRAPPPHRVPAVGARASTGSRPSGCSTTSTPRCLGPGIPRPTWPRPRATPCATGSGCRWWRWTATTAAGWWSTGWSTRSPPPTSWPSTRPG